MYRVSQRKSSSIFLSCALYLTLLGGIVERFFWTPNILKPYVNTLFQVPCSTENVTDGYTARTRADCAGPERMPYKPTGRPTDESMDESTDGQRLVCRC